jgi:8-amino-7-oxononanoate synthase
MDPHVESLLAAIAAELEGRERDGLRRRLRRPGGIDFASNDYLGLSRHPRVRQRMAAALEEGACGAPSSRLLRGHDEAHERLEARFARFKGAEAALFFPSGYQANLGLMQALMGPEDRACSDALNHASIIDGLRLARPRREIYSHLDVEALDRLLAAPHRSGRSFVVTESLFSMDGDLAPLDRLAALAAARGACLIVDEAHATGLYGESHGAGLLEALGLEGAPIACVSTCGKALGLAGACVTGPRPVIDLLIDRARSFIYTTAVPPVLAEGVIAALDVLEAEPWRRGRALANARRLREALRARGVAVPLDESPIVPVRVGGNRRALAAATMVEERGYDVRALRPPSVPEGTARLRIGVGAERSGAEIDGVAAAVADALARLPPEDGR